MIVAAHDWFLLTRNLIMKFQVTDIEFDFEQEDDFEISVDQRDAVIRQTLSTIWDADDEDDLVEEITFATGWCIKKIDYVHVLSWHNHARRN